MNGRAWRLREAEPRRAATLRQKLALSEISARLLAARGFDVETAPRFLDPRLRDELPDPSHLKDLDKSVERLADAVVATEPIAVFGDYDVDGATSAALLHRYLAMAGAPLRVYVPDRVREGYGPNVPALRALKAEGARVVVMVDCGVTAHEPLAAARDLGLDVIVVDHHAAEPTLPPALAIINPNRLDETSPHRGLAAVGVAFLLVVALNRELRRRGHFVSGGEPDLLSLLDLVALGTVCDVVPLTGLNRALVSQGLKVMARRANAGIAALAEVAGVGEQIGAYHAGFVIGPRINAGGRVGASELGWRLLATQDPIEARALAARLDALNRERRAIETEVLSEAEHGAERAIAAGAAIATVSGRHWHPGVIGIVAARLVERLGFPACVIAIAGGLGKGSGRSIPGVDLGAAVIAARQAGLLVNGGGHKMAAGFTVAEDKIEALGAFLAQRLAPAVAAARLDASLSIDAVLAADGASIELAGEIEKLAPFGVGNPEPRLVLAAARLAYVDTVAEKHLRLSLPLERGGQLRAMAFRAVGSALGNGLLAHRGGLVHLAGRLRLDHWKGRESAQIAVEDAAPALQSGYGT
jgi:single-stranded-DNA-specific exonuclease